MNRGNVFQLILKIFTLGKSTIELPSSNPKQDQKAFNKIAKRRGERIRVSKDTSSIIFKDKR